VSGCRPSFNPRLHRLVSYLEAKTDLEKCIQGAKGPNTAETSVGGRPSGKPSGSFEPSLLAMKHDLVLDPDWVRSEDNEVADALSRFDIPLLSKHYPPCIARCLPTDLIPSSTPT